MSDRDWHPLMDGTCGHPAKPVCYTPTPGAEFAAICNGGEDAAKHEAARTQAKALAQDWAAS